MRISRQSEKHHAKTVGVAYTAFLRFKRNAGWWIVLPDLSAEIDTTARETTDERTH